MMLFGSPKQPFSFYYKDKEFIVEARECSFFRKGTGLMFRPRNTDNLVFSFNKETRRPFTGLFCFFPFLIIWLDKRNKVLSIKLVKPFESGLPSKKPFKKVLELPLNRKNKRIIQYLVGKANI
jgi:uncharacterized membrane protein (UPF0127 family)